MDDPVSSGAWLNRDFDYRKLTVLELRRIFIEHDIDFKSTQKKAELVGVYEESVLPRLEEFKTGGSSTVPAIPATPATAKRSVGRPRKDGAASVKRRKQGQDAGLEAEQQQEEHSQSLEESSPAPKRPHEAEIESPRKSPRKSTTKADGSTKTPRKTAKTPRKKAVKDEPELAAEVKADPEIEADPEQELEVPKTVPRTGRKSKVDGAQVASKSSRKQSVAAAAAAAAAVAPPLAPALVPAKETPRQSKSEDSAALPAVIANKLNLTPRAADLSTPADRRARFSTDNVFQTGTPPPIKSAVRRHTAVPRSAERLLPPSASVDDEVAADQLVELSDGSAASASSSTSSILRTALLTLLAAAAALALAQYRAEKITAGYCYIDSVPHPQQPFKPVCQPCPEHGTCMPGFKLRCNDGFVPSGGFPQLGFSPSCVPDTERLRRVRLVADEAVRELRTQNARAVCTGDITPELTVADLHESLLARKSAAVSREQFDELFNHAIDEVQARDEIVQETNGTLRSTSLADAGIVCRARRSFTAVLERYRATAAAVLILIILGIVGKQRLDRRARDRKRVVELVARCFDELVRQKRRAVTLSTTSNGISANASGAVEATLGVSQLRDGILREVFSSRERERLWRDVAAVVEANSNVRPTQAEIEGEWLRAWEWIGHVQPLTQREQRLEQGLQDGDDFVRPLY
ncbi:inner nuclear membrane protein enriched at telomere/subtelomere region [Savitreella phatthalungensis]